MAELGGAPNEPSYRRLAATLREEVLSDAFGANDPLPTEQALTKAHGLSRQTVRRAYLELVSEGLIYRVPGRGTFVTPTSSRYRRAFGSVTDLMNLTLDTELEILSPLTGTFDEEIAARLQVTKRVLYALTFRRFHNNEVFCTTHVYLPQKVGALLESHEELLVEEERSAHTVIGLLESHGVTIGEAEQTTTAVAASEMDAANLDCDAGDPLLHIERLYFDETGSPVELAISNFVPERFTHQLRLARDARQMRAVP